MPTKQKPLPQIAMRRILAGLAGVPVTDVENGTCSREQVETLNDTAERFYELLKENGAQLTLAHTEPPVSQMEEALRRGYRLHDLCETVMDVGERLNDKDLDRALDHVSEAMWRYDEAVMKAYGLEDVDATMELRARLRAY